MTDPDSSPDEDGDDDEDEFGQCELRDGETRDEGVHAAATREILREHGLLDDGGEQDDE